jgi:SAM-dependent methyltransferase
MSAPAEIRRFWDEQARRHGADVLATVPDPLAKKLELDALERHVPRRGRILDLGCGNGLTLLELARSRPEVSWTGLDYSAPMVRAAAGAVPPDLDGRVRFLQGDVLAPPLEDGSFDAIYSDRLLINLVSWELQQRALGAIHRLLRPGGLYVMVENYVDGLDRLNAVRGTAGLPPIPVRWHNRYLREAEVDAFVPGLFEQTHREPVAGTYFLVSRVINAKVAQQEGREPEYLSPINRAGAELPSLGDCTPILLRALRKPAAAGGELRREGQIRPQEAHARYQELFAEDMRRFLVDGAPDPRRAEPVACAVCGGRRADPAGATHGFPMVRCRECGLLYVTPRLRPEVLAEFYRTSASQDFFQNRILAPTAAARRELVFGPPAERVCARVPKGRLLDVGCSRGDFLEAVRARGGPAVEGLELHAGAAAETRRRLGVPVHTDRFEEAKLPEASYDAVTCWTTIMLLPEPLAFLRWARRILRPGGCLFFSCTNSAGFDYGMLGERHPNLAPTFLVHLSPPTARRLLRQAGFEHDAIETPGKLDVDIVRRRLEPPPPTGSFLHALLAAEGEEADRLRGRFQAWLQQNLLSGYMEVTAW